MPYFEQYKDKKGGDKWRFTLEAGKHPVTGKRNQVTRRGFASESVARKACSKIEQDLEKGLRMYAVTLGTFITNFFETIVKNKVSEGTYVSQWIMVEKYIIPRLGHLDLKKIDSERLDTYYNELLNAGVSRGYIRGISSILSKTFKQAVKWNRVIKNVVKEASPPPYKPKQIQVWTESELIYFLDSSRAFDNHALYVLDGNSGMRIGEALALEWSDIDEFKCTVSVNKSLKYTKSKGLHIKTTKNDNANRAIIVPRSTIDALLEHKGRQLPDIPIVFDNVGEYIYPSEAWRRFINDCAKLKMPRMKIHGLRHTHATLLLGKGFNPKVVAERLGDTVETVLRTYAHVLPSMQKEVAASLENMYKSVDNSDNVANNVVTFYGK